jgi:hypothetical protein
MIEFKHLGYSGLNDKQQENFNFQKVSGVLADYGFSTVRLTADWQGADFIAQHADGITFLRVQLKSRLHFSKTYLQKDLWMCFREGENVYLFPHDEVLDLFLSSGRKYMKGSRSWELDGGYSCGALAKWMKRVLEKSKLQSKK